MPEHYFSPHPQQAHQRRELRVRLAGATRHVTTDAGVFSHSELDRGTRVLLENASPLPETGTFLDLGCGWGPIALTLALERPSAQVYAVDTNCRAIELAALNAQQLGLSNIRAVEPDQVPTELTFETIWSNPPIRIGKTPLHELLRMWLPRLTPDAQAQLVIHKHLGADSLHRWLATTFEQLSTQRTCSKQGYRILEVRRGTTTNENSSR